jgi:hypothetical protein
MCGEDTTRAGLSWHIIRDCASAAAGHALIT